MSDAEKNINNSARQGKTPSVPPMKVKATESTDKKKKSPAPIIIIIIAAVLLLGGAIFAAVKFAGNKKPGPVVVTDGNGVPVTTPEGEPVTVEPETEVVTYVDASGETQTTVIYKEITVNVTVTDKQGEPVTEKGGEVVTTQISYRPEMPSTTRKNDVKATDEKTTENTTEAKGPEVIGSTVVYVTDGTGNTGVDSQGDVITTVVPITSVPAIVEEAKTEFKTTQGGSQQDYFSDVALLADGSYITANVTNSTDGDFAQFKDAALVAPYTVLTKYGKDGSVIWQKAYGSKKGITVITSVVPAGDGGFYAAGYGKSIGGVKGYGFYDGMVCRFDANGDEIWHKIFGTSTVDLFNGICTTSDGGVVAVGSVGNNDCDAAEFKLPELNSAACAVKYSANGDLVWKNVFAGNQDSLNDVVEGTDGSLYAVGTFYSGKLFDAMGNSDAGVVKLSDKGKVKSVASIAGTGIESFNGITLASDGCIVVVGRSNSSDISSATSFFAGDLAARGGYDAYIVKLDPSLKVRFAKAFRGQNDDRLSAVVENEKGNFIAVGYTNSSSRDLKGVTTRGGDDMVIACFDKNGDLLWARAFGGTKDDSAEAICLGSDGGYVIAGRTLSNDVDLKGIAPYVSGKAVAAMVIFPE